MLAFLRATVRKQRLNALPVSLSSNTIRSFATKPSSVKGSNSFVVSYLINSCGLCPQSAASVSKRVKFQSPNTPNSVLKCLKDHGFSQTQISIMIRKRPDLLICNAQKTIAPKLELFRSKAISGTYLIETLSNCPHILTMSLKGSIIPCFDALKSVAQLDDKQIIEVLKKASYFPLSNMDTHFAPNIALLRELGIPQSSISYLVSIYPYTLFSSHTAFAKVVEEVNNIGFDRSKLVFVLAIPLVFRMTESKWASKFELFGRYGWCKEEVYEAFRNHPTCMSLSDKKISSTMDFLVEKIGWPSKDLVKSPVLLFGSLEKRIKPRCLVVQALMSKGLVKKDLSLYSVLLPTEEKFVKMFVTKFQETVPELLNVYRGEVHL